MNATNPRLERYLSTLKSQGRSSPAGLHWHEFYEFLRAKRQPGRDDPPVPLILGASGESNANKHGRLSSQLEWALENGCIDTAIRYLEGISVEKWNSGPLEQWDRHSYDF